ncbi:alpha/beta hydrolase family protein [Fretibacter rubidus]|uniref:alpha/beta hydrolase family protein n=1 Tax=Fretibacter rubidus TaxID=570162 RepID=UPI00352B8241
MRHLILAAMIDYEEDKSGKGSWLYDYRIKTLGDPKKDKDLLKQSSALNNVDKIDIPILLIHGVGDKIIPVSQSRTLSKAMKDNGVKTEYMELPFIGHNLVGGAAVIHEMKGKDFNNLKLGYENTILKMREFFEDNLEVP